MNAKLRPSPHRAPVVTDVLSHGVFAALARENQQFENRSVVDAGGCLDGRNAHSVHKHLENRFSLVYGQVHAVQRLLLGRKERLRALAARELPVTLTVASVAFAFDPAVVAGHCDSP